MSGKYIVIEGPDGTGKTTQAQLLAKNLVMSKTTAIYVHEPGETSMGIELEALIKNRDIKRSSLTDLLLFTANRIELFEQVIEMKLREGVTIVADRNWLSSIVYQGMASGLGEDTIETITRQMLPERYTKPDATILLTLASKRRQELLGSRGTSQGDYFETKPDSFQQQLIKGYESLADNQQLVNEVVSAEGTIDEVQERVIQALKRQSVIPQNV